MHSRPGPTLLIDDPDGPVRRDSSQELATDGIQLCVLANFKLAMTSPRLVCATQFK